MCLPVLPHRPQAAPTGSAGASPWMLPPISGKPVPGFPYRNSWNPYKTRQSSPTSEAEIQRQAGSEISSKYPHSVPQDNHRHMPPASPELHSAAKQNKTGTHPSAMPSETERKAKASASDYSNRSKNNWCLPVLSRSPDSGHPDRHRCNPAEYSHSPAGSMKLHKAAPQTIPALRHTANFSGLSPYIFCSMPHRPPAATL